MTLNLSYQAGAGIWSFSRDTNDIQGHHSVVAEEKKKVNQGLFKVISDMPLWYRWAVVSPTVAIDNAVSLGRYQLVKQWKMEMVLLMNMSACKLFDIEKLWWNKKKKKDLVKSRCNNGNSFHLLCVFCSSFCCHPSFCGQNSYFWGINLQNGC